MQSIYSSFLIIALSLVLVSCGAGGETASGNTIEGIPSQGVSAKPTNLLMGRYQDFNNDNFTALQAEGAKKILLYVYSPTCEECRSSTLSIIKAFNTLQNKEIAGFRLMLGQDKLFEKKYNISKAGTVVVLKGTEEIARKEGKVNEEEVIQLLK